MDHIKEDIDWTEEQCRVFIGLLEESEREIERLKEENDNEELEKERKYWTETHDAFCVCVLAKEALINSLISIVLSL